VVTQLDLTEGGKIAGDTERIVSGKFATVPAEPHSKQNMQATALSLFSPIPSLLSFWLPVHPGTAFGCRSSKANHPAVSQIN